MLRSLGWHEGKAALRDAWCFRAGGEDPGSAGSILRVCRQPAA
jgi:hypothetical protein